MGAEPAALEKRWARSLAVAAACGLEAEIVEPLGLSGLSDVVAAGCPSFSLDDRLVVIVTMLELLRDAQALEEVGIALLKGSRLGVVASTSIAVDRSPMEPALPSLVLNIMLAGLGGNCGDGLTGVIQEEAAAENASGDRPLAAAQRLAPWLTESLVQTLCVYSSQGNTRLVRTVLNLCILLAGPALAKAMLHAKSRMLGPFLGRSPV